MAEKALEITDIMQPDGLAKQIANTFVTWEMYKTTWASQKKEIREYLFATDTRSTTNVTLGWKNSVHIPKLCQIRDNLHANYMAALFPNDQHIEWEGDDESSDDVRKRRVISAYMTNKLRQSRFRATVSQLVLDYIDWGNCFGMIEFVNEQKIDPLTQETIPGYVGPRLVRLSPLDIVFDPTAARFEDAPKIVRTVETLASLRAKYDTHPDKDKFEPIFTRMKNCRHAFRGTTQGDYTKNAAYQIDGFSGWEDYMDSNYVEILTFYGDLWDPEKDELLKDQIIRVVDRSYILHQETNPSWFGTPPIFHVGWRLRPDNLYAMGPLDNLVGMQYRIDHLENAKSDAYDLIIHPVMKVAGTVEDFEYGPGERIYCGDDGDVSFMPPDTTMLSADTQIQMYENRMEEMAGAPRQAMGFRTPGEKTAYEVQILENGANRVFLNKTSYFEEVFLEPILNAMLEVSRRNMQPSELIRVVDEQYGLADFMKITKEDITARGKIRPIGARRFARNANLVQNLTQVQQTIGQDPSIMNHFSGLKMAQVIEELLGLGQFDLVQENVRLLEQAQSQKLAQAAQQTQMEDMAARGATEQQLAQQAPAAPAQA